MKYDILKKIMVTGLSTALCIGGVSMADLSNYNGNVVESAYAATIKDNAYTATGTITSNVSMRKGPGTSYARVATLKKGVKVNIVAKSSNSWYKIKYKNGYTYVYSQYVKVKSNIKETTYSATAVANHAVYVRKGADTSYSKLGYLKKDAKVTIVAKTSNGWYKVKFNGSYGYVLGEYLNIKKADDTTNKDVAYNATGVVKSAVYVRKGAKTSYAKLGTLQKNTKVTIVAKSSNGWYKINYKDGTGYVSSQYITITKKDNNEVKYPTTGVINHAVYVRKGAKTSYAKLGTLQKDAKVTILSKTTYGWYKINYKDGTGYVYSQYVDLNSSQK